MLNTSVWLSIGSFTHTVPLKWSWRPTHKVYTAVISLSVCELQDEVTPCPPGLQAATAQAPSLTSQLAVIYHSDRHIRVVKLKGYLGSCSALHWQTVHCLETDANCQTQVKNKNVFKYKRCNALLMDKYILEYGWGGLNTKWGFWIQLESHALVLVKHDWQWHW